jgi:hypothetical protein
MLITCNVSEIAKPAGHWNDPKQLADDINPDTGGTIESGFFLAVRVLISFLL